MRTQSYAPSPARAADPQLVRPALRRLRAEVPHVLFLGETVGGDVGASLYAHRTRGQIDGLIDSQHFFRG